MYQVLKNCLGGGSAQRCVCVCACMHVRVCVYVHTCMYPLTLRHFSIYTDKEWLEAAPIQVYTIYMYIHVHVQCFCLCMTFCRHVDRCVHTVYINFSECLSSQDLKPILPHHPRGAGEGVIGGDFGRGPPLVEHWDTCLAIEAVDSK